MSKKKKRGFLGAKEISIWGVEKGQKSCENAFSLKIQSIEVKKNINRKLQAFRSNFNISSILLF